MVETVSPISQSWRQGWLGNGQETAHKLWDGGTKDGVWLVEKCAATSPALDGTCGIIPGEGGFCHSFPRTNHELCQWMLRQVQLKPESQCVLLPVTVNVCFLSTANQVRWRLCEKTQQEMMTGEDVSVFMDGVY